MRKHADLLGPSPYTGEENPLNQQYQPSTGDHQQRTYHFVYIPGQLELSADNDHKALLSHLGLNEDYSGPLAMGYANVSQDRAHWSVHTNISLRQVIKEIKSKTKHLGWKWDGVSDIQGRPVAEEGDFAPGKKSYVYSFVDGHLYIARDADRLASNTGETEHYSLQIIGKTAYVDGLQKANYSAFEEWARDQGLVIKAMHDNQLKRMEDLEQGDLYSPNNLDQEGHEYFHQHEDDGLQPPGTAQCHQCGLNFKNFQELVLHQNKAHSETPEQDNGHFPMPDAHAPSPVRFHEFSDGMRGAKVEHYENGKRIAYAQIEDGEIVDCYGPQDRIAQAITQHYSEDYGKLLPAPIPWVFDIKHDKIFTGHPGSRVQDIQGTREVPVNRPDLPKQGTEGQRIDINGETFVWHDD